MEKGQALVALVAAGVNRYLGEVGRERERAARETGKGSGVYTYLGVVQAVLQQLQTRLRGQVFVLL